MKTLDNKKTWLRVYLKDHMTPKEEWQNIHETVEDILIGLEVMQHTPVRYPLERPEPYFGSFDEAPEEIKADLKDLAKDKIESDLTDHTS